MNYFIFKNKSSLEFKDLIVNELPTIERASEKVEEYDILGRNGKLHVSTGTYESTVKEIECTLKSLNALDELLQWLKGDGEVIFSNQLDRRYKARIINSIPFERVIREFRTFVITLECEPFSYLNETSILIESSTSILNRGNIYSEPKIKVNGLSGTITINNEVITINNDNSDYFFIDSEILSCYDEDLNNTGRCMNGDYPILNEGVNTIMVEGDITIEVFPNWRNI